MNENQDLTKAMKLVYKKDETGPIRSFFVKRVKEPVLDINWHFHEEYELIYIIKGHGIRLVGDNLTNFQSGELVMVGPNIPHLWRTSEGIDDVDRIIIKFDELPNGSDIFSLPEFAEIRTLLKKAGKGISFGSDVCKQIHSYLIEMTENEGASKWICLLNVLQILAKSDDFETLTSSHMKIVPNNLQENRFSKIIEYISENYYQDISLEKIADIASMTVPAFCRYFKRQTNKTFVQFLNEYRIGKGCVLLVDNKLTISQIWVELGFNSSTNFNRAFRNLYHCTPKEYRKKYARSEDTTDAVLY